jgi:hypothetical protein
MLCIRSFNRSPSPYTTSIDLIDFSPKKGENEREKGRLYPSSYKPISETKGEDIMTVKDVQIPKDITNAVDQYIPMYKEYKKLEAKMKKLRKKIEPFMKENDVVSLEGTEEGFIRIEKRNIGNTTARYSTYDPDLIAELPKEVQDVCVLQVIDRDKLEALVALEAVDEEIVGQYKNEKIVPCFTIDVDKD